MRTQTESGTREMVALAPLPTAAGAAGNRTLGPAPAAGTTDSRVGAGFGVGLGFGVAVTVVVGDTVVEPVVDDASASGLADVEQAVARAVTTSAASAAWTRWTPASRPAP